MEIAAADQDSIWVRQGLWVWLLMDDVHIEGMDFILMKVNEGVLGVRLQKDKS